MSGASCMDRIGSEGQTAQTAKAVLMNRRRSTDWRFGDSSEVLVIGFVGLCVHCGAVRGWGLTGIRGQRPETPRQRTADALRMNESLAACAVALKQISPRASVSSRVSVRDKERRVEGFLRLFATRTGSPP